jgi:hypothetical protein
MNDQPKKIKGQFQGFRPRPEHLKRILGDATKSTEHPTLEDIEKMAKETIKQAPTYIKDEKKRSKQVQDAKLTIEEVKKAADKKE